MHVWRIIDSFFISTAYQRPTFGVSRVSMANVLRMCHVRFAAVGLCDVLGVLGIFCGVPRESLRC